MEIQAEIVNLPIHSMGCKAKRRNKSGGAFTFFQSVNFLRETHQNSQKTSKIHANLIYKQNPNSKQELNTLRDFQKRFDTRF